MRTNKKINYVAVMVAATLLLTSSCKKPDRPAISIWHKKSIGISTAQQGIIEMSTYRQNTCYGIFYNLLGGNPPPDITITHDGGRTWHSKTIAGLENNSLFGVAATTANIVHVIGWNNVSGGGNVFRSTDGGDTWHREAANAFADPASFPDDVKFFDADNGVIFGDPKDGYFEIYTTSNGGDSWIRVASNKIPAPLPNEYGVPYYAEAYMNTIWVITMKFNEKFYPISARLLQSDDKGLSWYVRNSALPLVGGDGSLKFRNNSIGLYKNNGILYRTIDGGTTFSEVNYSGKWFSFDLDNVPGKTGWWISTGGGASDSANSARGFGSSISYDDGNHWITLDTAVNHTCVDMTGPIHGYSGGVTTGTGDDGVFVYSPW
jgi:hypothetical protein